MLTVAVRLLLGIETAQHVLECACSVRSSYCHSSGRLMQRCERRARVGSRAAPTHDAQDANAVSEGSGAWLLTVAVRLPGGTETAQHALECACSALGSYSLSSGRLMRRCERTARVGSRGGVHVWAFCCVGRVLW